MITDNVSEKDQEIIQFLKNHSKQCYDKDFILRLSLRFKKHEISIFIYSELSLYEEAVNLALERDMLKEAKNVVSLVSDKDLKKQLWLKIASLMIGRDRDIKNSVTTILQECGSVLSIKDLLPLFDEFVTIANLKEELVRNLEKHSMQITKISRDIKDSLKIKQEIKQDIKLFEKRYEKLSPGVSCSCCSELLQTRKFFVYPCGHTIHTDCIIKEILHSNEYSLKLKIEAMQKSLGKHKTSVKPEELDSLLSRQCPLCSEIRINSIDEPWEIDTEEALKWQI